MELNRLIDDARALRFTEPGIEEAYRADRIERGLSRTRRVIGVLLVILVGVGATLGLAAGLSGRSISQSWLLLRFGVLAPSMAAMWLLTWTAWGRQHLQTILSLGFALAVGSFSVEWAVEWKPGMTLRGLWMIPLLTLWGCAMALPMSTRAVAAMTMGTFVISTAGIAAYVEGLDTFAISVALLVFTASGYGIVLFARWREIEGREGFVNRMQNQILADELLKRNEALVQVNQLRDTFVEGVLHDIRSPLTAILMSSSMLKDARGMSEEERIELVEGIERAGSHIDRFVTRFLEQRSLDRAEAPPVILETLLSTAIDSVVSRARMSAARKGQELVVETLIPGSIVRIDELLLDRALGNLLDNAIKYSPLDARITLRIEQDPEAPGRARLSVTDQGPGISGEEMGRLFQPYSRLEKKTTAGEHSVGLGLSLVKKWIESMGGAVGCESESGRGSTFWLSLPLK